MKTKTSIKQKPANRIKPVVSGSAEFQSEHKLFFEIADWMPLPGLPAASEFKRFRVGSCDGLWRSTSDSYDILAITNNEKGNGHLRDVLQWFEQSCRRDKKVLRVLEVWNSNFKKHLIEKCSFKDIGSDNVERHYR